MGEEEEKEGKAGKEEVQRLTGRNGEQLNEHQPWFTFDVQDIWFLQTLEDRKSAQKQLYLSLCKAKFFLAIKKAIKQHFVEVNWVPVIS